MATFVEYPHKINVTVEGYWDDTQIPPVYVEGKTESFACDIQLTSNTKTENVKGAEYDIYIPPCHDTLSIARTDKIELAFSPRDKREAVVLNIWRGQLGTQIEAKE